MDLAYQAKIEIIEHQQRRLKLFEHMLDNSALLVFSNQLCRRNNDCDYPFRQDSYFWYLTGFNEPDSVLLLIKQQQQTTSIIFVREKDKLRETWDGYRLGVDAASATLMLDQAFNIANINELLTELLKDSQYLYHAEQLYLWADQIVEQYLTTTTTPPQLKCWRPLLDEMRLIKSKAEQALMQQAAQISALAHIKAMQTARVNRYEYELEGEMIYEYYKHGARFVAYNSIVGSGNNACTLHYIENDSPIKENQLVLIDAACEFQYYAADITRTFPVSGKYTTAQREIYSLVLTAQKTAIDMMVIGATFKQANDRVLQIMVSGLVDLGILTGDAAQLIADKAYLRFYMHGLGHWLGLDVHDVGAYSLTSNAKGSNNSDRPLQAGMVLTIEPGLYIPDEDDIPIAYRGIGVRIEDDILITAYGPKNLSSAVPREIDEIETLLANR